MAARSSGVRLKDGNVFGAMLAQGRLGSLADGSADRLEEVVSRFRQ